jgi:hypothetical protein
VKQKKENFLRISENRKKKIIELLSSFENFANTSFYDYDEKDLDNLFAPIVEEANRQKQKLLDEKKKKRRIRL